MMQVKKLGEVGRRGETGVIERVGGEKSRVVGEGVTGGSQKRVKTQPNQGNQTPTHNGQGGNQRGERV